MLNQHDLKQHDRIYTGTAVVLAIQISYKFIHLIKVDCCIDLTQQMVCRNHFLQTYKFNLVSVLYIFRKHVHHPYLLYHISPWFTRKRPPCGDLFRQAEILTGKVRIFPLLYIMIPSQWSISC